MATELPIRDPNVFFINGQNYEVPDELLAELRNSWNDNYSAHGPTKVPVADQQWVMDFIRIVQLSASNDCNDFSLVSIVQYKGGYRPMSDQEIINIGEFDEAWTISACTILFYYRVTHNKNRNDLEIRQIEKVGL